MSTVWVVVAPLASKGPDPADVRPGWIAFGLFIALAVAVVLLWLSMRRQLRKIDFVEEPDLPVAEPGAQPQGTTPEVGRPNGSSTG